MSTPGKEKSATPVPTPSTSTPRPSGPQFIDHLPRAEDEALKKFIELPDNVYQYKTLGLSRQAEEGFTCDCTFEPGDDEQDACGEGSNCINRLTQVECLEDDCRCRSYCQNQRFQRKQYASFHIVKTEMKGFGLRAAVDMLKDTFIYEYIGEVVSHPSFAKRMREYAEEGIKHFYFMMLQKDEFIDATKKGGIGRFANHSCNPNCYVAKWTIGKKVRMGIFAKRDVRKGEELTFNYNVDRYGHDAQPCYCGEPNCVGFIGGKTQTDIAAMDDVVLDALGVTEEVEKLNLNGQKRKKNRKLEDLAPVKPLDEKSVPKVLAALSQTSNRKLLVRLLARINATQDVVPLRELMRLRGFSKMTVLLREYSEDEEICATIMSSLPSWPLTVRNKVDDSRIEEPIKALQKSGISRLEELASKLVEIWAGLPTAYRIPKRSTEEARVSSTTERIVADDSDNRPSKRVRFGEQDDAARLSIKPLGKKEQGMTRSYSPPEFQRPRPPEPRYAKPTKEDLAAIIAAAMNATKQEEERTQIHQNGLEHGKKPPPPKPKEGSRDSRVLKMVGDVVVKTMSKYRDRIEYEAFKKHARNVTHLIAEKEKRSKSYQTMDLSALSDSKKYKIKKFTKEY
ncbi:hypothetical protein M422DRAFT_164308, partial [Sphaerobolus stellatus SS14]